ncbi:tetratricopeptide repeat protein [Desulfolutivibrio sp.]|uniref:tetratricopeptide repeat protein n=1 Tax=Desulfolutivibrio sp. TaxID=2773296 RepID=UPI002F960C99
MPEYPIILGVYSLAMQTDLGVGDTAGKHQSLTYWYARQLDAERFEVQPLNVHHVPSGVKKELPVKDFLTQYVPEPRYYKLHTVPALETLAKKLEQGEQAFSLGNLDEAERQFVKALMIDDLNVTATYGVGKVASEKKDYVKLKKVLGTLLHLDEAFSREYREQFNSFGITLRKNKNYDEALAFYGRALELSANDDHVHFNMARAYYEKNTVDACIKHLNLALSIRPDFVEARKFLDYVMKHMGSATA